MLKLNNNFLLKINSIAIFLLLFIASNANSQSLPIFDSPQSRAWADSVMKQLSLKQKIGQLFMVDAYSDRDSLQVAQINTLIDSSYIGGIIFFKGGPIREAVLTNNYQSRSKVPLMIGMDAEWGISMRLDSTIRFPRQMTLAAGNNAAAVYAMGKEIGIECKRMGIQINFAPAIDINNNPLNPVINSRSFGEDRDQVTRLGTMYMKGMQDQGVMACGKHFPGHGNTSSDSHLTLPIVQSDKIEMDSMELMPFRSLIKDSLASVMVAHLYVPSLDSTANRASTMSSKIVTDLLQHDLGFRGLIFTDALNMKGVADYYQPGELELKALLAGNDVLLYSENVPKAISRITLAVQDSEIAAAEIDRRVRKILMSKYWSGLNNFKPIDTINIYNDLVTDGAQWLNYQLYDGAITLLSNKNNFLPLSTNSHDRFASVVINDTVNNPFQQMLNRYAKVDCFSSSKDATTFSMDSLITVLNTYDRVVVSIHNTSTNAAKNFNITDNMLYIFGKLANLKTTVACVFGNAYVLGKLEGIDHQNAVILSYEDTYLPQLITAQKLFGASSFTGKIPVSPTAAFPRLTGDSTSSNQVLKYSLPQDCNINSSALAKIDSIINKAIADSVFPGCQVVFSKDGKIIYDKSFGYHTYDHSQIVKNSDLYDIASVTKIAATALATMLLVDKHKLDPDAKISKYLPEFKHSNKRELTLRELMAHQAGLQTWIPFWKSTVDSSGLNKKYYRTSSEKNYTTKVADSLYILNSYPEIIWEKIIESPVDVPGKYVYSDLDLLIMQKIVEKISAKPLDEFVNENFYQPLGIWRTGFLPRQRFDKSEIIPTENDTAFRHQLIQGYVHDPAAAMMGGVAGHAGVFSNAESMAVLMQLLLNNGVYGGKHFIKEETINLFTSTAYPGTANRRGLIFDKPEPDSTKSNPTAKSASANTFGHQGFTGTCVWADPDQQLVFIFLSNRVYPSAENNKLAQRNIRTDIMQVVYDAIKK